MTPEEIDKAVSLFSRGERPSRIAARMRRDAKTIRAALEGRGLILKQKPPGELRLGLPRWALDRLESCARNWKYENAAEVAALVLLSRLARGSIGADLKGVGMSRVENLSSEKTVRELIE